MPSNVIKLKDLRPIRAETLTAGSYLWWGMRDKSSGHPVLVTGSDSRKGTVSFIPLNDTDTEERIRPIGSPNLHYTTANEVREYVVRQLGLIEPQQTCWSLLCETVTRFCRNIRTHYDEQRMYRSYKRRLKHLKLL